MCTAFVTLLLLLHKYGLIKHFRSFIQSTNNIIIVKVLSKGRMTIVSQMKNLNPRIYITSLSIR